MRLLSALRRLFAKPAGPPPRPQAVAKYVLYTSGDGGYEIKDGGHLVGSVQVQPGYQDKTYIWSLSLHGICYDFTSLKAVKEWLGEPAVRRLE